MKHIFLILLLLFFQMASAEVEPYVVPSNFGEWLHGEGFIEELKQIPKNQYPIVIEAGPLLGDGAVFRVLLKPKPNKSFQYKFVYGVSKEKFMVENSNFRKLGFTLIYHQAIQGNRLKIHQAVWVKSGL